MNHSLIRFSRGYYVPSILGTGDTEALKQNLNHPVQGAYNLGFVDGGA